MKRQFLPPGKWKKFSRHIESGDISWIDRLTYYSFHVKGSPGYWRYKRSEVYTWINHHIEMGHGPPSFFITFSCAEHYWEDVKRLILERKMANSGESMDTEHISTTDINNYAIVVQEYFQHRVQNWLATVGKHVFKIRHHWLRYEFAPGRGQIHAHMLAIADNMDIQQQYYDAQDNPTLQATLLQSWVQDTFGMTASTFTNATHEEIQKSLIRLLLLSPV